MNDHPYYRPSRTSTPSSEIVDSHIQLPADPTTFAPVELISMRDSLKPRFSLSDTLSRNRIRNELRAKAYEIFRNGVITKFAQEMDLTLYRDGLQSAAAKNTFLTAHIKANKDLARALHEEVIAHIETMTDQQVEYALNAEMTTKRQTEDVRAKAAGGQISPESADHMITFIQDRRDEKIRRILEYSDRDLNKLSEMVAMAQSTVLRSIDSNG